MRVQADDGAVAVLQMAAEILNLVGVAVRRGHFHGVRQVQNHFVVRRSTQFFQYPITDQHRIFRLRTGKTFGGIFIANIDIAVFHFFFRQLADQPRTFHGNVDNTLHIGLKYHLALQGGRGIIKMHDHVFRSMNRVERFTDQMGSCLHQDLNRHIIGNQVLFNQGPQNFIFRFTGRGEPNFDFFKTNVHQRTEKTNFFFQIHGVYQRLVPIAQIHAAPNGRLFNAGVGPVAVLQINRRKRTVLLITFLHNQHAPF